MARLTLLAALAALAGTACAPQPELGEAVDLTAEMPGGDPAAFEARLPRLLPAGPAVGPEAPYLALMDPPVVQPVWIPAGLNRHGDLVSGYWVYLKVREAAFYLEREDEAGR